MRVQQIPEALWWFGVFCESALCRFGHLLCSKKHCEKDKTFKKKCFLLWLGDTYWWLVQLESCLLNIPFPIKFNVIYQDEGPLLPSKLPKKSKLCSFDYPLFVIIVVVVVACKWLLDSYLLLSTTRVNDAITIFVKRCVDNNSEHAIMMTDLAVKICKVIEYINRFIKLLNYTSWCQELVTARNVSIKTRKEASNLKYYLFEHLYKCK